MGANGYDSDSARPTRVLKEPRSRTLSTPSKVLKSEEKQRKKEKKEAKLAADKQTDDEGYQSTFSTKSKKKKGNKFFRKFSRSASSDDEAPPPVPSMPPVLPAYRPASTVSTPVESPRTNQPSMALPIAARFATTLNFDNADKPISLVLPRPFLAASSQVASPVSSTHASTTSYDTVTSSSYFPATSASSSVRQPTVSSTSSRPSSRAKSPPPPTSSSSFFQKPPSAPQTPLSRTSSRSSQEKNKERRHASGGSDEPQTTPTFPLLKRKISRNDSADSQTSSNAFKISSPFKGKDKDKAPARPVISYPLTRSTSPLPPPTARPPHPHILVPGFVKPASSSPALSPALSVSPSPSPLPRRGVSPAFPRSPILPEHQRPSPSPVPMLSVPSEYQSQPRRSSEESAEHNSNFLDVRPYNPSASSHGSSTYLPYRRSEDSANITDDDDRSIYPDNRQTMYDDSDAGLYYGRETVYTLNNASNPDSLAFLDQDHSSEARSNFLQGVERMYDERTAPPMPAIPDVFRR